MKDGKSPIHFVPLGLGLLSLLLLATYSFQRARLSPANETAQARLHLLGAMAALIGLAGFGSYFVLRKMNPRSKVLLAGLITNFIASVWGFILNFH